MSIRIVQMGSRRRRGEIQRVLVRIEPQPVAVIAQFCFGNSHTERTNHGLVGCLIAAFLCLAPVMSPPTPLISPYAVTRR